jgi:hypothetical protein
VKTVLCIPLVLLMCLTAKGQNIEYQGSTLWSSAQDIEIVDTLAYCKFRNGLIILDLDNPSAPRWVGQCFLQDGGYIYGQLTISGIYAYLTDYSSFKIMNITDPANPYLASTVDISRPMDVSVRGNYAFVVGFGQMSVVDITDPVNPEIVTVFLVDGDGIMISGSYAYIWNTLFPGGTIAIVNLTDPANPVLAGNITAIRARPLNLSVVGNYAYIAEATDVVFNGLEIFDISNPQSPQLLGFISSGWRPSALCISGNYAYVGTPNNGLQIFNISEPNNPSFVGASFFMGSPASITIRGNYAFIADIENSLMIFDISDPSNPTQVGAYGNAETIWSVAATDRYAYVIDSDYGLKIIDLSDSGHPQVVGNLNGFTYQSSIALSSNYAIIAGVNLDIVDIASPVNPTLVGNHVLSGGAVDIFASNHFAFIAEGSYLGFFGLEIYDFSDPANPQFVNRCSTPQRASSVFVDNNIAYVGDEGGLEIIDVSNPESLSVLRYLEGAVTDVYVSHNYVYLVNLSTGLTIFNVIDPSNPIMVGHYQQSVNQTKAITVAGNYAYVVDRGTGLNIIDVSYPSDPVLVTSFDTPGDCLGIFKFGNNIHLADRYSYILLQASGFDSTGCNYIRGDVNGNGIFNGMDVVYTVRFFKGGNPPPYSCECTAGNTWYVTGDVNGSCSLNSLDVTYMARYFEGGAGPIPCPDCPPSGL